MRGPGGLKRGRAGGFRSPGSRSPVVVGDVSARRRPLPWGRLWWVVVLIVLLLLVQLVRPVPRVAATPAVEKSFRTAGSAPAMPWPTRGSAAVGASGLGVLAESDPDVSPRPIASVAKLMTALVVLDAKPLQPVEPGPTLTVTDADVASYLAREAAGESTLKVEAGEVLTERQALEGLLVPSGNNVGEILARWVAGSTEAFVERMNAKAKALGLGRTTFGDPSGLSARTTSIPRDLVKLGMAAMEHPVIREIVVLKQAELPVAGIVYNVNYILDQEGIVGVKTGSSSGAGACFVFASRHTVEGREVLVYGAVMGLPTLEDVFNATKSLIRAVRPGLIVQPLLATGQKVARYESPWGAEVDVVATKAITAVGWPGVPVRAEVAARPVKGPLRGGANVGSVTVRMGAFTATSPLVTEEPLPAPGKGWRLLRLF